MLAGNSEDEERIFEYSRIEVFPFGSQQRERENKPRGKSVKANLILTQV